jgi:hypothetical protein
MFKKIMELFGVVRTFVFAIVLAAVAGAMSAAEFPPLGIVLAVVLLGVFFWLAPFGAKYRKNF